MSKKKSQFCIRLFLINSILLSFSLCHTLNGQSLAQPPNNLIANKNIFGPNIKLEIVDDFVPFLNLGLDDVGYTLGTFFSGRFPQPAKNRYFEFMVRSLLYTKSVGTHYIDNSRLYITPQQFTEISHLSVAYNKYNPVKKLLFRTEIAVGVYNQQEIITGLSLFLQGGENGKKGFHGLLGKDQARQENIPTGGIQADFYTQFSVKKFYFLNKKWNNDPAYLSIEPGAKLVFPLVKGSQFFFNIFTKIPIVRMKPDKKIKFRLAAIAASEISLHANGLLFLPEWGIEFDLSSLRIGYTMGLPLGPQPDSYINYSDPDPLMRLYFQFNFN